jgi:hypothetical protein
MIRTIIQLTMTELTASKNMLMIPKRCHPTLMRFSGERFHPTNASPFNNRRSQPSPLQALIGYVARYFYEVTFSIRL